VSTQLVGCIAPIKIPQYKAEAFSTYKNQVAKNDLHIAIEPMTDKEKQKQDRVLAKLVSRYYERLMKPAYPVPTLFWLMAFRGGRASVRWELDESSRDYTYYKEKGWFTSDYFYPVRLGPLKKLAGGLFDSIATRKGKKEGRANRPGQV
jgi:hypothetical protein